MALILSTSSHHGAELSLGRQVSDSIRPAPRREMPRQAAAGVAGLGPVRVALPRLLDHAGDQGVDISRRYDKAVDARFHQVVARAAGVAADHGKTRRRRFVDHDAPGFEPAWKQQTVMGFKNLRQSFRLDEAEHFGAGAGDCLGERTRAADGEPRAVRTSFSKALEGRCEKIGALLRDKPSDEEEPSFAATALFPLPVNTVEEVVIATVETRRDVVVLKAEPPREDGLPLSRQKDAVVKRPYRPG